MTTIIITNRLQVMLDEIVVENAIDRDEHAFGFIVHCLVPLDRTVALMATSHVKHHRQRASHTQ